MPEHENLTALILEDEAIIGFALEDMLLGLGYRKVDLVTSIQEARAYLESNAPSVAVLDVNIRGERSYVLADMFIERGIPFLFATGYGDAEHPLQLRSIATLTKPYSLDALKAALAITFEQAGLG